MTNLPMPTDLPSDLPPTGTEALIEAAITYIAAVADAVNVCSYGWTIGEAYVPFDTDDEDGCSLTEMVDADGNEVEYMCEQVWMRIEGIRPMPGQPEGWTGNGCSMDLSIDIEVGIQRCITIEEGGEAPKAADVLVAAVQSVDDMRAILDTTLGTEVWQSVEVGEWRPSGPTGGQYGGLWTFTVEV